MTSECVVDAELFKKYCLENSKCDSCQERSACESSSAEVAKCLFVKDKDKHIIKECGRLEDFLEYVQIGKCTIYYNEHIKKQYVDMYDKLPMDLMESINRILSTEGRTMKIDRGKLNAKDFALIDSVTILKSKKHYLDIAAHLQDRKIISTQEDKKNVYHPKLLGRLSLVASCMNVCEQRDEIWNKIKIEIESKQQSL